MLVTQYNPFQQMTKLGTKMKHLLISLISFFAIQTAHSSEVIYGELAINGNTAEIYSRFGKMDVTFDANISSCFDGIYKVTNGKLVQIISCRDKGSFEQVMEVQAKESKEVLFGSKGNFCSFNYKPVCGLVSGVPHTFGNECELKNNGATKIFNGNCKDLTKLSVSFKRVSNFEKL